MLPIQNWIHRLEVGGGLRFLRPLLLLLALAGMILSYNFRGFRNMSNPEAMDAAQVGRNLAEHKGFSTLAIRPLSIFLLQRTKTEKFGPAPIGDTSDRAELRGNHPDLANPPVYPLVLAGLMKVVPAGFMAQNWNLHGAFWIHAGDFVISVFNQILFLGAVAVVFLLARQLFDDGVAWTSAILFLGTDLFWRFSISGLSTMLLLLIFLALVWRLLRLERTAREGAAGHRSLMGQAALLGVILGLGALTRYSFGWLILPVGFFIIIFLGKHRVVMTLTLAASFCLVLGPWLARNYQVSHTLFGTSGYAVFEGTPGFPEFRLQRSLNPDVSSVDPRQLWSKLVVNTRGILQDDVPRLGGNWVIAFFMAGVLLGFRNPALSRFRWFLVSCFPVLIAVQALGRTHLSDVAPVINSENLLILLVPMLIIFGVSIFFTLLDQFPFPDRALRLLAITTFCVVTCLPMILTFVSPRTSAVAYPPYYPPVIEKTANWMKPDELMMSDIPCAMAWYGRRQCIWLTLNAQEDFYQVYDFLKPVKALYLTPETMDARFLTEWVRASEHSWGKFILEVVNTHEIPPYFPLRKAPVGFLPEQFFLSDMVRWQE